MGVCEYVSIVWFSIIWYNYSFRITDIYNKRTSCCIIKDIITWWYYEIVVNESLVVIMS